MSEDRIVSYAQNREDMILAGFFPKVQDGFYVDVGAHHPIYDSVTKYFYNKGWHGINIEPNPRLYKELMIDRPEDNNLNVGIADKPGKLKLRIYDKGDGLSTFSEKMKKLYEDHETTVTQGYHDEEVKVTTLKDVFNSSGVSRIHFLKIDIEGYEYNALVSNDWDKYRPEIICIEANHIIRDWRPLLKDKGYRQVFFDGLNEYYVSKEARKRAENFSYVDALLARPIISLKWDNTLKELMKDNQRLKSQMKTIAALNNELEHTINVLNTHIQDQLRTKNLIKNLINSVDRVIMRNLNKITEKPHYYPLLNISDQEKKDASQLIEKINEADKGALEGHPSMGRRAVTSFGGLLTFIYVTIRRITYRLARAGFRGLKRFRKQLVRT